MRAKSIGLRLIKHLPLNSFRIFLLKKIFNYSIGKNVKIGKTIINCAKVTIGDNVYIASNNVIVCNELSIGDNTAIHSGNVIQGNANFYIGDNSRIINNHYFDVWNTIQIGNNTWVAGKSSQFWTHGSIHTKTNDKSLSIVIKNDIYIGSACSFAPGVVLESGNLIGLGSVVTKCFFESKTIIAGNPAVVIKKDIDWRTNW